jgi:hypothetical protein
MSMVAPSLGAIPIKESFQSLEANSMLCTMTRGLDVPPHTALSYRSASIQI